VEDDWHALATRLPGMARQLAQHCELVERGATLVRLRLAPAHKHLQTHQEKLQLALRELWGAQLRLDITVAEPASETPAARRQNTDRERQENAIASIEQDPFVRDVVDLFDASIDEATIKPV
jgi:DNA polymerase-3 subunit gamma/tau